MHDFSGAAEVRAHRRTFEAFGRLVLFAILHIGLSLACLALAFLGHAPLVALMIWLAGTLTMIAIVAVAPNYNAER
jgi:hypothetical protein